MIKFAIVFLKKKHKSVTYTNADGMDAALFGASLVKIASEKLAKEKNISEQDAMKAICDSILETPSEKWKLK